MATIETDADGSGDESLENGTRASTPTGDNLLTDYARAEAAGYGTIIASNGGRLMFDDELGISMADSSLPMPFGNLVHLTRPIPTSAAPQFVDTVRSFFGAEPGGPFLMFCPWPFVDLGEHGFHLAGHPPLMVRPPGPAAAQSDLRIDEVKDPAQLEEFERTLAEAYPAPEVLPFGSQPRLLGDSILESPTHRLYVGYEDDRAVATALAFVDHGVVAIEAVSARSECRGRGYGAAITAAATTSADDPALLVASDLGRSVYERLGYMPILRYTLWLGFR